MSNLEVSEYLLAVGLRNLKGVVFLDENDRQMVLLRQGFKVVTLAECGLKPSERFTFYDQVHTTGMDIKQAVDAKAALTLGKDMTFRDYAQGAFRMRGIGKGQTIELLIVPEIAERIRTQVAIGQGMKPSQRDVQLQRMLPMQLHEQLLKDVIAWLVINSMRSDSIQFNLLCEQVRIRSLPQIGSCVNARADYGNSFVCLNFFDSAVDAQCLEEGCLQPDGREPSSSGPQRVLGGGAAKHPGVPRTSGLLSGEQCSGSQAIFHADPRARAEQQQPHSVRG
jgi:hypothetical protein